MGPDPQDPMQNPLYSQILVSPLLHLSTSIAQCQRGPLARLWHPGGTGHITLSATAKGQLLKEVVSSGWSWIRPPVAPTCMYPGCDPGRVIMEQPRQAGTHTQQSCPVVWVLTSISALRLHTYREMSPPSPSYRQGKLPRPCHL